jgi:hypothetical protein
MRATEVEEERDQARAGRERRKREGKGRDCRQHFKLASNYAYLVMQRRVTLAADL